MLWPDVAELGPFIVTLASEPGDVVVSLPLHARNPATRTAGMAYRRNRGTLMRPPYAAPLCAGRERGRKNVAIHDRGGPSWARSWYFLGKGGNPWLSWR